MNNQRICTTCKTIKPFSDFNWDSRFNLPFSRCKPCYNKKCKDYRESKQGKENYRKWVTTTGKQVRNKAMAKWRSLNSNKRKAHTAVSNALRDKKIFKLPCKQCNNLIVEAHHHSYEKENWLNVTWLCKKHHTIITYNLDADSFLSK